MMWLFSKRPPQDLREIDARLPREIAAVLAAARVPRFRDALPQMVMELERARRYGRSVAVALFAGASAGDAPRNGHTPAEHTHASDSVSARALREPLQAALLGAILLELVRETDIVAYAAALGRCTLLMPEIGDKEARLATSRLRESCSTRLMVPIWAEVAVFPKDGLTLEELIAVVEARSDVLEQPRHLRSAV